jgi:two-component system OmpR family response regulator
VLKAGGDDYLVKPFAFAELSARVNAIARRPVLAAAGTVLQVGDLKMDLCRHTVERTDRTIDLQPREFRLLEYLMRHPEQVITRTMLLENVWDFHFDPRTTVVETHINRLRSKLDLKENEPSLIETVRGAGYRLREEVTAGLISSERRASG